jgi:class 3 adenylate cyclase
MTRRVERLTTIRKVVVFFDICSSSSILEDLAETDNPKIFRNMILALRDFLHTRANQDDFIPYKFIGDGWILLFPSKVSGASLINFLTRLSDSFRMRFDAKVVPYLQRVPKVTGLTFGVDEGSLIKVVMNDQNEYLGRALNVSSRLQGAIKDNDKKPAYKILFSKPVYKKLRINEKIHSTMKVKRSLRNISGGMEMKFVKLTLPIGANSDKT